MQAKRLAIVLTAALLIPAALGAMYVVKASSIKNEGIELHPRDDHPVSEIGCFLQNDPLWTNDPIGRSTSTLGAAGCLVSSAATAISSLGIPVTPKLLNEKLTAVNGYDGDRLIWRKLKDCLPGIDYKYARVFSAKTLEDDLESGLLPIVSVKYGGGGVTHWVLVAGAKNGEFMIYDPLNAERTPIPLSVHGRVFAYRVLIRTDR